ncbi:hypothetical protein DOTSEDRAFT_67423 [Dothistroma septosporum NZE10]|uniref:Heterokaryon incompatibility domain-containing protein n=1 Tax=Dothistroma septosporum (strain NZE10 / CBS 128990) TaxID=675120 RepID=N1PY34_DOTSN|nr:hypothetical protein DOTSEDRAFT_67423 [Dothistroma septosporum NZE10]
MSGADTSTICEEESRTEAHENEANASPTLQYQYKPLKQNQIRLIRLSPESAPDDIRCSMHRHSRRRSNKRYIALSYSWGDLERNQIITLNGSPSNVTTSLWQALSAFVSSDENHTDLFWIDALCINQDDTLERNHQVQQMGQVYSSALVVYSWLGQASPGIDLACTAIRQVPNVPRQDGQPRPDLNILIASSGFDESNMQDSIGRLLESTETLLHVEYFDRVWIISEIARAKKLIFVCGSERLQSGAVLAFLETLVNYIDKQPGVPFELEELFPDRTCTLLQLRAESKVYRRSHIRIFSTNIIARPHLCFGRTPDYGTAWTRPPA